MVEKSDPGSSLCQLSVGSAWRLWAPHMQLPSRTAQRQYSDTMRQRKQDENIQNTLFRVDLFKKELFNGQEISRSPSKKKDRDRVD